MLQEKNRRLGAGYLKNKLKKIRRKLRQRFDSVRKTAALKRELGSVKAELLAQMASETLKRDKLCGDIAQIRSEASKTKQEYEKLTAELARIKSGSEKKVQQATVSRLSYYTGLMISHRWLMLILFFIFMLTGMYLAITLPRIYKTTTLILLEPRSVVKKYVEPFTTLSAMEYCGNIVEQIKSRTYIEMAIAKSGLFSEPEYNYMLTEEKVEAIRRNMKIEVKSGASGVSSFTISLEGKDPEKIAKAVNILAECFIDECIKIMREDCYVVSKFLQEEVKAKAEMLIALENIFRKKYQFDKINDLPEELESNSWIFMIYYKTILDSYRSLLTKKLDADIAVGMQMKLRLWRFRILDSAEIPKKPISPDIKKLFLMCVAMPLGLGVALIFLQEFLGVARKPKLKNIDMVGKIRKWIERILCFFFIILDFFMLFFFGIFAVKNVEYGTEILTKIITKIFL